LAEAEDEIGTCLQVTITTMSSGRHAARSARKRRKANGHAAEPPPHLVLVPSPKERDPESVTGIQFCARVKAVRERRGVTLATIAQSTKVTASLFEAFERGDLSRWPKGIYRRAYVRDYATAIGLPAEPTVREFLKFFPDEEEALSAIDTARRDSHRTLGQRVRSWFSRRV
jgi:transcriptional regulator with XRE-family HTH domain